MAIRGCATTKNDEWGLSRRAYAMRDTWRNMDSVPGSDHKMVRSEIHDPRSAQDVIDLFGANMPMQARLFSRGNGRARKAQAARPVMVRMP